PVADRNASLEDLAGVDMMTRDLAVADRAPDLVVPRPDLVVPLPCTFADGGVAQALPWKTEHPPVYTVDFHAVWGSGPKDLYVVGKGNTILRSTDGGMTFARETSPLNAAWNGVWGSSATDVYVVG